ncbi:anti-anti-sigma factor [Actinoplanes octamycinicus]|uniref:Anti-anti-sigma factor n=1 Tax=Actinoplanes octamycinicus TaxID=135948 RepID=A0A7W7H1I3_9ACTN|nr:STAS domain-containing protein [Actinoplanes octamycinicus]MBB4741997.1 anti-anti-sigma factor [Actinoplanes octamycinicus]GIE60760.1 hypothetical protein Aoc01nite_61620 [Actinoplanes octamycinicus]
MWRHTELLLCCELTTSDGHLALAGEIDLANAAMIETRLIAALAHPVTELDCRAVTFLGAPGVRALLRVAAAALAAGITLHLHCSPAVAKTLDLCGCRRVPGAVLHRYDC